MAAFEWAEQRVEQLKSLWEQGRSASQIADEMGTTRNSAIGKIHRLGLARKEKAEIKAEKSKPKGARVGARSSGILLGIKHQIARSERDAASPRQVPKAAPTADVVPLHIGLMDLTDTTCRWPYGAGPVFTFCGCHALSGKPYCEEHSKSARRTVLVSPEKQERRRKHGQWLSEQSRRARAFA